MATKKKEVEYDFSDIIEDSQESTPAPKSDSTPSVAEGDFYVEDSLKKKVDTSTGVSSGSGSSLVRLNSEAPSTSSSVSPYAPAELRQEAVAPSAVSKAPDKSAPIIPVSVTGDAVIGTAPSGKVEVQGRVEEKKLTPIDITKNEIKSTAKS